MTSRVLIKDIEDYDPFSREGTLLLETPSGEALRCYYQGLKPEIEKSTEGHFLFLEADYLSVNDIFNSNKNKEKKLEQTGYWDYFVYGQIVAIENGSAVVDCGGIFLNLENFTEDDSCIGEWVGFKIFRLEFEEGTD